MEPITVDELLALSRREFIERVQVWVKEFEEEEGIRINNPIECPVHSWVVHNNAKCAHEIVANTAVCPVCGNPCCPDCMNHVVHQLSRVTGYLSTVDNWNESKKQEFKDRQRFDL